MVAYIDEFKDRFRGGPIRRVLAASLDCGFITPRGYRMFRSRPVSRMAARHEALARDILEIHADFFMAVYGHRKTHARLLARGRDPAEIGRDQVMNVMRESGIRGVRRGRTPVTTKPAKGTGGRPDLVERGFEAEAPNRPHVADITYVRMANGPFGHTTFVTDVFARRIVGWACATTMDTGEPPLQALEQAISWAASHGGTDGLVHHSDHGAQYISLVCTTRVGEFGMLPSTGTVGDSYDNAMAESADGAYKTELVWRRKPFQDLRDLELATFRWVSWWNSKRLHQSLDYRTPGRTETEYYANQAAQAAPL
ncbi:IS3 family transposase [Bifidobacterium adolescentis]|nr:IS3 family transposase [Bifidobacterium adolescentis]